MDYSYKINVGLIFYTNLSCQYKIYVTTYIHLLTEPKFWKNLIYSNIYRTCETILGREFKVNFLLGTAECGKSTILKQIRYVNWSVWKFILKTFLNWRILKSSGFPESELNLQKFTIHRNLLLAIRSMVQLVESEGIKVSSTTFAVLWLSSR